MSLEKLVKLPKMLVPGSSPYDAYTALRRGEQTQFGEALKKDGTRAVLYTNCRTSFILAPARPSSLTPKLFLEE